MKQAESTATPTPTSEPALQASAGKTPATKSKGSNGAAKNDKSKTDLDALLEMIGAQDETLKALKQQIQEMLGQNNNIRRGLRQVVKDASRNDALEAQLSLYKKKWSSLKNLLS